MKKFKKYLPVISNACFLMSISSLVLAVFPKWWITYVITSIVFEVLFVLIVIFIVPVYKRTFPKLLGNIKVKPKSAIRNMVIDILGLLMPLLIEVLI